MPENSPISNICDLEQSLLSSVQTYAKSLHGRRVWLACSGGRDSLSLALMCRQLFDAGKLPFLPQLLHVNHGMQAANLDWARQVAHWAQTHAMPCTVLSLQPDSSTLSTSTPAVEQSDLIQTPLRDEQSARAARYQAMIAVMNEGDVLMLGHHQDDQVETVLMRLFNGAGVSGLSGMKPWQRKQSLISRLAFNPSDNISKSPLSQQSKRLESIPQLAPHLKHICVWRPWLSVSRAQISAYAKSASLTYIDDPTNTLFGSTVNDVLTDTARRVHNHSKLPSPDKTSALDNKGNDRAWLRSVLLPIIHQRYPAANSAIDRSSQLMQAADSIVNEQATKDLTWVFDASRSIGDVDVDVGDDSSICNDSKITKIPQQTSPQTVLNIERLQRLSYPRQAALVHHCLTQLAQPSSTIGSEGLPPPKRLVDDILCLCNQQVSKYQAQLQWRSGVVSYTVCRYQSDLYVLRDDWLAWLQQPPLTQVIMMDQPIAQTCLLKACTKTSDFEWYLTGMPSLFEMLLQAHTKHQHAIDGLRHRLRYKLKLMPLSRELKVQLLGRAGRKSGKKLLQALQQPIFMRGSVMVASIVIDYQPVVHADLSKHVFFICTDKYNNYCIIRNSGSIAFFQEAYHDEIPLFIITLDGIHLLAMPPPFIELGAKLQSLTDNRQLVTTLATI